MMKISNGVKAISLIVIVLFIDQLVKIRDQNHHDNW